MWGVTIFISFICHNASAILVCPILWPGLALSFSCGVTMAQLVTPWPFQCHPPFPQNLALSHNWLKRDSLCSVFLVPTGPFLFRLLAIPAPWRHLCNKWRKLRGWLDRCWDGYWSNSLGCRTRLRPTFQAARVGLKECDTVETLKVEANEKHTRRHTSNDLFP